MIFIARGGKKLLEVSRKQKDNEKQSGGHKTK